MLVRPSKSIHDVDARAVRKTMKDKAFAANVNRQGIVNGAEELGKPRADVRDRWGVGSVARRGSSIETYTNTLRQRLRFKQCKP
jgi:hypothetical protein